METEKKEFWTRLFSVILAVLFMLYGTALLILGITVEMVMQDYRSITTFSSAPVGIVITFSIGMLAVGVMGLRGFYTGNLLVLKLYFYISLGMVLVELVAGILCFVFAEQAATEIAMNLHFNTSSYRIEDSMAIGRSVDGFQKKFECCGYTNFLDWADNPSYSCESETVFCQLPNSCCFKEIYPSCLYSAVNDTDSQIRYKGNAYGTGCKFAFTQWLQVQMDICGITSLIAVSMQVVCCLALYWYVQHLDMNNSVYRI